MKKIHFVLRKQTPDFTQQKSCAENQHKDYSVKLLTVSLSVTCGNRECQCLVHVFSVVLPNICACWDTEHGSSVSWRLCYRENFNPADKLSTPSILDNSGKAGLGTLSAWLDSYQAIYLRTLYHSEFLYVGVPCVVYSVNAMDSFQLYQGVPRCTV